MAKQKTKIEERQIGLKPQPLKPSQPFLFSRENYLILGAGLLLMAIGYMLMSGGAQPADKFDPDVVYSFRRTTLSTIVVLLGFGVAMYSIFWKRKVRPEQS